MFKKRSLYKELRVVNLVMVLAQSLNLKQLAMLVMGKELSVVNKVFLLLNKLALYVTVVVQVLQILVMIAMVQVKSRSRKLYGLRYLPVLIMAIEYKPRNC